MDIQIKSECITRDPSDSTPIATMLLTLFDEKIELRLTRSFVESFISDLQKILSDLEETNTEESVK